MKSRLTQSMTLGPNDSHIIRLHHCVSSFLVGNKLREEYVNRMVRAGNRRLILASLERHKSFVGAQREEMVARE